MRSRLVRILCIVLLLFCGSSNFYLPPTPRVAHPPAWASLPEDDEEGESKENSTHPPLP